MLQFEHPSISILAAIFFALLLSLFIYHKEERFSSTHPSVKIILTSLRFISYVFYHTLFKQKLLNEIKQVEKPIIIFLQEDASSSILNYPDSIYYTSEFKTLIEENNNILSENLITLIILVMKLMKVLIWTSKVKKRTFLMLLKK